MVNSESDFKENSIENGKFRLVGVHSDIACALINIDFNKFIGKIFDIYQFLSIIFRKR